MGWKAVKEHYGIVHIVKMEEGSIHIGSGYVGNAIVISPEGLLTTRFTGGNADLQRYQDEMEADPVKLLALIRTEDVFERSITVYTWEEDRIVERLCEEPGWPNVTHDGEVMYENRFSTDRDEVVQWMVQSARSTAEGWGRMVDEARRDLEERQERLDRALAILASVERAHPEL